MIAIAERSLPQTVSESFMFLEIFSLFYYYFFLTYWFFFIIIIYNLIFSEEYIFLLTKIRHQKLHKSAIINSTLETTQSNTKSLEHGCWLVFYRNIPSNL